jgi:hypothetical protein
MTWLNLNESVFPLEGQSPDCLPIPEGKREKALHGNDSVFSSGTPVMGETFAGFWPVRTEI